MMIFFVMKNGVMASSHKHILFFIWAAIKEKGGKMILQEYLEIRPNGKSCSYYKNLGYNVKRL